MIWNFVIKSDLFSNSQKSTSKITNLKWFNRVESRIFTYFLFLCVIPLDCVWIVWRSGYLNSEYVDWSSLAWKFPVWTNVERENALKRSRYIVLHRISYLLDLSSVPYSTLLFHIQVSWHSVYLWIICTLLWKVKWSFISLI